MHLTESPLTAEMPSPVPPPPDEADVFEPASTGLAPGFVTDNYAVTSSMPPIDEADFARTIRMAELYASEGSIDEARDIYEDLLARDPNNASIRAKLDALGGAPPPFSGAPPPSAAFSSDPAWMGEDAAEGGGAPLKHGGAPLKHGGAPRNPRIAKLESWLA